MFQTLKTGKYQNENDDFIFFSSFSRLNDGTYNFRYTYQMKGIVNAFTKGGVQGCKEWGQKWERY